MSNLCVSSVDSRVGGHNSGLVLGIKDQWCSPSDTCLHVHHSLMYCEACLTMVLTSSDRAWSVSSSRSWATILTQWSLICSFMCCCLKWDSSPYLQYKCWTHFSLYHTMVLNKRQDNKRIMLGWQEVMLEYLPQVLENTPPSSKRPPPFFNPQVHPVWNYE